MSPCRSRWSGVRLSQTATSGLKLARQVELIGRHLDHVDAPFRPAPPGRAPRGRYCRRPRPAGPASASTCPISAVVVDLPLVPVIATKRARPSASRHSSSMSQTIATPASSRHADDRVRLRVRERHAGRKDEAVERLPRPVVRLERRGAEPLRLLSRASPCRPRRKPPPRRPPPPRAPWQARSAPGRTLRSSARRDG